MQLTWCRLHSGITNICSLKTVQSRSAGSDTTAPSTAYLCCGIGCIPAQANAQQVHCLQDRKEKDSFFNWFYFAINLGSFLAVTTLVYIQESVSWTIGFAIPAVAMLLAVVTFVAGR